MSSGTVTAKGVQVNAQSEAGLAIRYKGGAWGSSATATEHNDKDLYPISTNNLVDWFHATAAETKLSNAEEATRRNYTSSIINPETNAFIDSNAYVVMEKFDIRSSSSAALCKGLYVSGITVTTTGDVAASKTLSTALRVGVMYKYEETEGDQKVTKSRYHIYAPVTVTSANSEANSDFNSPSNNYLVNGEEARTVTLATMDSTHFLVPDTATIPVDSNGVTVEIYVWMEGEDHNLFSDNYNPEDLNVSVEFKNIGVATT